MKDKQRDKAKDRQTDFKKKQMGRQY